jgi:hypothetical protein
VEPVFRGAKLAGRGAVSMGAKGAGWAKSRGEELLDRIPAERIEHEVRETVSEARDRIEGFVQSELADLRRALRRQRKRLGV